VDDCVGFVAALTGIIYAPMSSSLPVPYLEWRPNAQLSTAGSELMVLPSVHSPQLDNARPVVVYLPPSYRRRREHRYRVVYMHDGQNLFDRGTSFAGVAWGVDACMARLAAEGVEAIIVGVWHTEDRQSEYTPFGECSGGAYLQFLVKTLKPLIDGTFRTVKNRANTGILGSSMGGLISTYAFFKHATTFGFFGAMSPAYWPANGAIYEAVKRIKGKSGRAYLDNGNQENSARRMVNFLGTYKGLVNGDALKYVDDPRGEHNEASWARRLPDALRFLLG
jgi:predicted alpha/beta superfamily hydrolase